jgi:hypothetical protein
VQHCVSVQVLAASIRPLESVGVTCRNSLRLCAGAALWGCAHPLPYSRTLWVRMRPHFCLTPLTTELVACPPGPQAETTPPLFYFIF